MIGCHDFEIGVHRKEWILKEWKICCLSFLHLISNKTHRVLAKLCSISLHLANFRAKNEACHLIFRFKNENVVCKPSKNVSKLSQGTFLGSYKHILEGFGTGSLPLTTSFLVFFIHFVEIGVPGKCRSKFQVFRIEIWFWTNLPQQSKKFWNEISKKIMKGGKTTGRNQ